MHWASCGGAGAPPCCRPPSMAESLPPTPSPTSRPRPGAATKTGTCRPARRASSGAGSTCPGLAPAPAQRHRATPPGPHGLDTLPKMTLGMPNPESLAQPPQGAQGTGTSPAPRGAFQAQHGLPRHAGQVPKPSPWPCSIRRRSHPNAGQGRGGHSPAAAYVRAGDPVAGHGGKAAGRGRIRMGQCSFLRRWPGEEGCKDACGLGSHSPAPGRGTMALTALRRQSLQWGHDERGGGQAEPPPQLPATPRACRPGYTQEAALVLSTTRRVNKHPAFNCCHAQTCLTAPGLRCHLPLRTQHLLRASAPHEGQQGWTLWEGPGCPRCHRVCRGMGGHMDVPTEGKLVASSPRHWGSSSAEPRSNCSRHSRPRK